MSYKTLTRIEKTVWGTIAILAILLAISFSVFVWSAFRLRAEIKEKGIQGIVHELWEGDETP